MTRPYDRGGAASYDCGGATPYDRGGAASYDCGGATPYDRGGAAAPYYVGGSSPIAR
jgi:hypothetical protein